MTQESVDLSRTSAPTMPSSSARSDFRVFVSYRRSDSSLAARTLRDDLVRAGYSSSNVFFDVSQDYGESFPDLIEDALRSCDVFLAVIGPDWASITDNENRRRLDIEQDWTRREIETALERGITVIPLLVEGAQMPRTDTLPSSISELTTLQAAIQTDEDWWDRLLGRLDEIGWANTTRRVSRIRERNRGFVGQESAIGAIDRALHSDGRSAGTVVLTGLPGHGKTHLAVEFAHRNSDNYRIIWEIPSEDRSVAAQRLADLAEALRLPRRKDEDYAQVARAELERLGDWLLIFDNAKTPESVSGLLPGGRGHTIITSQRLGWDDIGATTIPIEAMSLSDAVTLLRPRDSEPESDLELLAEDLMRIPLALQQAGSYMKRKHISAAEYREKLHEYSAFEAPGSDSPSMFGAWRLCFDEIGSVASQHAQGAVELLSLLSYLGPDEVPLGILSAHAVELPDLLTPVFASTGTLRDALALLADFSQVRRTEGRVSGEAVSLHRTVQYFTRSTLDEKQKETWIACALDVILAAFPKDPEEVRAWTTSDTLLSHATAVLNHSSGNESLGVKRATLLDRVGVFHRSQARLDDAAKAFSDAARIIGGREGRDERAILATITRHLGGVQRDRGDFEAARESYIDALREHEKSTGSESLEVSEDHFSLGTLFLDLEDWESARSSFEAALRIRRGEHTDHHRIAEGLYALFAIELGTGNVLQAKLRLDDTKTAYRELGLQEFPEARFLSYLDSQLFGSGVASESKNEQFLSVVTSAEETYGTFHPELADWLVMLGDDRLAERDVEKAEQYYRRARDIDQSAYGDGHWKVGRDLLRMFIMDVADAKDSAAREHLVSAIMILRRIHVSDEADGRDGEISLFALTKFDEALGALAKQPVAIDAFDRIVNIVSETWGEGSSLHASALEHLGGELQEHRSAQGHEYAARRLENAVAVFKESLGDRHARVARCLCRLGEVQLERGELDEAGRTFEEARKIIEATAHPNSFERLTALIGLFRVQVQRSSAMAGPGDDDAPAVSEPLASIRELAESRIGDLALVRAAIDLATDLRFDTAIDLLHQAAEIRIEKHGRVHGEVADTWAQIGTLHYRSGDYPAALEYFDRSLRINRSLYGPDHQSVVVDLSNRAFALARLGQVDEAVKAHAWSLETNVRLRGDGAANLGAVHARNWLSLAEVAPDPGSQRVMYEAGLSRMRAQSLAGPFLARLGGLASTQGEVQEAAALLEASVLAFASEGSPSPFSSMAREASAVAREGSEKSVLSNIVTAIAKETTMSAHVHHVTPTLVGVVPEDWFHKESITFLSPDGQANVIASSEPLDPTIDTEQYAAVQGDLLQKEFPGYDEKQFEPMEILGGLPGYIRSFEWTPPEGVTVTQMQLYVVQNGRGYTATATTPSSRYPELEVELRAILSGLSLTQHTARDHE